MVRYVQCLVCGRVTPEDKGICYHCYSPLPTEVDLPPGYFVCPNCLKVTAADRGYCRHCRAPLPTRIRLPGMSESELDVSEELETESEQGSSCAAPPDPSVGIVGPVRRVGPL